MIQREVLPNGVRIVTENITYVQSVALGIWVGVGARDEGEAVRGISHVIEHMLFKGTPTRSAQQIADEIDSVGGDTNAFTSKESTCYYARILSEHVPLAVDVLSDMFLNSNLDSEEMGVNSTSSWRKSSGATTSRMIWCMTCSPRRSGPATSSASP